MSLTARVRAPRAPIRVDAKRYGRLLGKAMPAWPRPEADIKAGRVSKEFSNHSEFIADLHGAAAKLGAGIRRRSPHFQEASALGPADVGTRIVVGFGQLNAKPG